MSRRLRRRYGRSSTANAERAKWEAEVKRPGKFEGEPAYVPYYWEAFLNGFNDGERQDGSIGFRVSAEDKAIFPELRRRKWVWFYERGDGFVVEV